MIKVNVFMINQVSKKPYMQLSVPVAPKEGDLFEFKKGDLSTVRSVWFNVGSKGVCTLNISFAGTEELTPSQWATGKK